MVKDEITSISTTHSHIDGFVDAFCLFYVKFYTQNYPLPHLLIASIVLPPEACHQLKQEFCLALSRFIASLEEIANFRAETRKD